MEPSSPPQLTETSRSSSDPSQSSPIGMAYQHSSLRRLSNRSETTTGSFRSAGSASLKVAHLHQNLMRCQKRDPFEIYETVKIMGEGSMGCVSQVRKRSDAVGGSARPDFVKRQTGRTVPAAASSGQQKCCFHLLHIFSPYRQSRHNNFVSVDDDNDEESPFNPKRLSRQSTNSSMISNQQYALKSIHMDKCQSETLQRELQNEIAILRELDHPHIARAIETYQVNDQRLFVVLELCSGGDLYARDPYTEEQAAAILASVFSALSYLHSKGIVHRDLKFENIMFVDHRPQAEVKLIDFGLSQKFATQDSNLTDAVGTVYTMAPELLAGKYNAKADIWSMGVVAFMLLSSSMPFYGPTRYAVIKKILKGRLRFSAKRWKTVSKFGKGLVRLLLEHDPNERPSADRALKYVQVWIHHMRQSQCPDPNTSTTANTQKRQLRWQQQDSMASYGTVSWEEDVEMMDRIQVSIQAFAQYNTLKKLALLVIAYKSTASEIGWLRTTFNRFDLLQNGEVSLEEFSEALSELYDYTEEEIEALFAGMDVDGTGSVHYTEFLAATMEAHGAIAEDRIADAFDRIDSDDSGYITIQNLRDFLGEDVPNSYLESIIDDADILHNKRISYSEFLELWCTEGDEKLRAARKDVAERRMKRQESLQLSLSDSGTATASDDTIGSLSDDENEPPVVRESIEEPEDTVSDLAQDSDILGKTPVINNRCMHMTSCASPVEFFSQRKALSLRAGWT